MRPVRVARLRRRALLRGLWRPGARVGRENVAGGSPGDRPRSTTSASWPPSPTGAFAATATRTRSPWPRGDRFLAVVCDGVASTANPDQAAQAATAAALAVLEPLIYTPEWPGSDRLEEMLGEAFAEAQRAVMQVPDDEPDGNELSPSTTLVVAVVAARGRRREHRRQPGLLAAVITCRRSPDRRRFLGPGEHCARVSPAGGLRPPRRPHDHPLDR